MTTKKLTPAKKRKAFTKLVEALRSGEYKQGTGQLRDVTRNEYCCLGVFCDVLMKNKLSQHELIWDANNSENKQEVLVDGFHVDDGDNCYFLPSDIAEEFDFPREIQDSFIQKNDGEPIKHIKKQSFKRIANLVEKTFLTPKKTTKKEK